MGELLYLNEAEHAYANGGGAALYREITQLTGNGIIASYAEEFRAAIAKAGEQR